VQKVSNSKISGSFATSTLFYTSRLRVHRSKLQFDCNDDGAAWQVQAESYRRESLLKQLRSGQSVRSTPSQYRPAFWLPLFDFASWVMKTGRCRTMSMKIGDVSEIGAYKFSTSPLFMPLCSGHRFQ
jgi:hypothetical protein